MPGIISSRQHDIIKKLRKLGKRTFRDESGQFTVEGLNLLSEAANAGATLRTLYYEESREEEKQLVEKMFEVEHTSYVITRDLMNYVSGAVTSQGILGIVDQLADSYAEMVSGTGSLFLVADQVRDPGNLGSLLRVADAAGAHGFLMTRGSVDLYNPKVVRAAAGSHFHIRLARGVELGKFKDDTQKSGLKVLGLDTRGEKNYLDVDFTGPVALVVGNEAAGISEENRELLDETIRIEMPGRAESLNVATATAVVAFEALRQRQGSFGGSVDG